MTGERYTPISYVPRLEAMELAARVRDAQADVAGAMAAATGATAYTDWEAMFEAEPLDGVFVCTPPAVHLGPARAAFERGMYLPCEADHEPSGVCTPPFSATTPLVTQAGNGVLVSALPSGLT